MTKEELINVIKEEVATNGPIQFAIDIWDGNGYNVQNGMLTDKYVIRDINGVEVKETYDEVDDDVLEDCYDSRVTLQTLFSNAHLNTKNDKMLMTTIVNDMLTNKIGEDSADLNLTEYGNHYDEVCFDTDQYYVMIRYYHEDGTEDFAKEPISNLSIEMLTAIFNKFNK